MVGVGLRKIAILVFIINALISNGCTSRTNRSAAIENDGGLIGGHEQSVILGRIKEDPIYKGISEDFEPSIHFFKNGVIRVELSMINHELQKFVGDDFENMLTTITGGFIASVIGYNIHEYKLIQIDFFDTNGARFKKVVLSKAQVKGLEKAGYSREDFRLIYGR